MLTIKAQDLTFLDWWVRAMVFNTTFNNISVVPWHSVLLGGDCSALKKPPTCSRLITLLSESSNINIYNVLTRRKAKIFKCHRDFLCPKNRGSFSSILILCNHLLFLASAIGDKGKGYLLLLWRWQSLWNLQLLSIKIIFLSESQIHVIICICCWCLSISLLISVI